MGIEEAKQKRHASLLKRYGSEEGIKQHYRDMQQKSMLNPKRQKGNHTGGFKNNPELATKMSKLATEARWGRKREESNQVKADEVGKMDEGLPRL